ncbi:MAG TPA: DUF1236 domain-containing protein, partial [Bradyrhizobium sp.]|nr:DUF1236 domain-containing protein [Bradyrhizobium sp.]
QQPGGAQQRQDAQSPGGAQQPQQRQTQQPSGTQQQPSGQQQPGTAQQQRPGGAQQQQAGGSGSPNLTNEQRTQIRTTVLQGGNVPRVNNVNFNVSVGTVVPRDVHVVVVPDVIVRIHPQWRGYKYFVYNDEIVILEPDSLRIVAVIPA